MTQSYFTREEAAAYLRVSVGTVDREVRAGRLFPKRLGRKPLFSRADLDAWFEQLPDEPPDRRAG